MKLPDVSLVPERHDTIDAAAAELRSRGAVIFTGIDPSPEAGVAAAQSILGELGVDVRPQFEASKALAEKNLLRRAALPDDDLRKSRYTYDHTVPLPPHNDGFAFGDLAPDHLFLNCLQPCRTAGDSWVLDGLALIEALVADPATRHLEQAFWELDVDSTDPGYVEVIAPLARRLPSGRVQVRMNPYQGPVASDDSATARELMEVWTQAKAIAAGSARRFRLAKGELLCVDNYRFAHSRDPFVDDERRVISTWAWTTEAIRIPEMELELI